MIGRDAERATLRDALGNLLRGEGEVVVIQGEAGIGKSRLLADLVDIAKASECHVFQGFATAIEKSTLYFAWREVLLQLLGVTPHTGPVGVREKLSAAMSEAPQIMSWAPLLDDIVHIGLPQTELTQRITGAARAASIEQVVVELLKQSSSRRPTVLVFDDLHWFDGASIALLRSVAHRLPEILVVVNRRSGDLAQIFDDKDVTLDFVRQINLDALSQEAVAKLVGQRLGATTFPAALGDFVHRHAGGNPFYCEELVLALRDTGAITLERDGCRISGDLAAASHSALSASVEGAIVSRIDALSPPLQMALKVASAIGVEFSAQTLQLSTRNLVTIEEISAVLERLTALELLRVQFRDGEETYDFRHAIIQKVTYDQLSFAQRRGLHRDIADCIERLKSGATGTVLRSACVASRTCGSGGSGH